MRKYKVGKERNNYELMDDKLILQGVILLRHFVEVFVTVQECDATKAK